MNLLLLVSFLINESTVKMHVMLVKSIWRKQLLNYRLDSPTVNGIRIRWLHTITGQAYYISASLAPRVVVRTHLPANAASPHMSMNLSTSLFLGVSCASAFSSQCTCTRKGQSVGSLETANSVAYS